MLVKKRISKGIALGGIALGALVTASSTLAADTQTLSVEFTLDKAVQAVWQGDDTVETGGGDGKITLDPSAPKTATLKVQCNSTNGYAVKFSTSNATGSDGANLIKGAGGDPSLEIPYTVALDVTGIVNATCFAIFFTENTKVFSIYKRSFISVVVNLCKKVENCTNLFLIQSTALF